MPPQNLQVEREIISPTWYLKLSMVYTCQKHNLLEGFPDWACIYIHVPTCSFWHTSTTWFQPRKANFCNCSLEYPFNFGAGNKMVSNCFYPSSISWHCLWRWNLKISVSKQLLHNWLWLMVLSLSSHHSNGFKLFLSKQHFLAWPLALEPQDHAFQQKYWATDCGSLCFHCEVTTLQKGSW